MPQSITKFGDIKLNQYDKECDYTSVYSKSYQVSGSNRLMVKYARHIKTMIDSSHKKQKALIDILKELFVQVETPHVSEYNISIHPSLTESKLNGIVKRTRSSIIELYSKCEHDYKKGIDLFKDVVNHVKDTAIPGQEDSINKSIIENAYIT
jgi:translation initiation factor 2B subunit (eIF-2B alpha/beta/delta family)